MSSIGYTGPRSGMTREQVGQMTYLLHRVPKLFRTLREGDCIGGDQIAAMTARGLGFHIVAHPPTKDRYRCWFPADTCLQPRPYLDRNQDIVDVCAALLATPDGPPRPHSGTWHTIDYARRVERPTAVIWPDGRIDLRDYGEPGKAMLVRIGWVWV
jgi:hypothetical protein